MITAPVRSSALYSPRSPRNQGRKERQWLRMVLRAERERKPDRTNKTRLLDSGAPAPMRSVTDRHHSRIDLLCCVLRCSCSYPFSLFAGWSAFASTKARGMPFPKKMTAVPFRREQHLEVTKYFLSITNDFYVLEEECNGR